jgi:peptidoglycan/xylan/chitin deacetylase (PgdA/CDA1 family)
VADRSQDPDPHGPSGGHGEGSELIAAPPNDARYYLEERFATRQRSARSLTLYYRLKPLIPRRTQLCLRRARARRLRRRHSYGGRFPRWPIEPLLVSRREAALRERLRDSGGERMPLLGLWPDGHKFAYVLTHDVEGPRGLSQVEPLLEIEARHGVVSAWFLVGEDYPVETALLDRIRGAGCEVGLHGLHHDGRLFESRERFERQLPGIRRRLRDWGAEGFRSPAAHRHAGWMPELGSSYDSSFHDTDPFDPQPGGCCSILPYFLGEMVELPITLPHDFTMFEILREPDIRLWREKTSWIAEHGGLVNVLVHPDYALTPERLRHYDELLGFLTALDGGWHSLPRDVAAWWRWRSALEAALEHEGGPTGGALAAAGAPLWWAEERDGSIVITMAEEEHAHT